MILPWCPAEVRRRGTFLKVAESGEACHGHEQWMDFARIAGPHVRYAAVRTLLLVEACHGDLLDAQIWLCRAGMLRRLLDQQLLGRLDRDDGLETLDRSAIADGGLCGGEIEPGIFRRAVRRISRRAGCGNTALAGIVLVSDRRDRHLLLHGVRGFPAVVEVSDIRAPVVGRLSRACAVRLRVECFSAKATPHTSIAGWSPVRAGA